MIVFLDHQHTGKPHKWNDCGAVFEGSREVDLVDRYIFHAKKHLESLGIDVCVLSDGHYNERHKRVNSYSRRIKEAVYVSCHINGGGGSTGISFYHHQSKSGKKLGDSIGSQLSFMGGIQTKTIACNPNDWTKNAFYTLKGVGSPIAICYEPFFIDQPSHSHLKTEEGLRLVGIALARGIAQFWSKL